MKYCISIFLFLIGNTTLAQSFSVLSFNACNMGKSKSDVEVGFMANLIKGYALIALQEIGTQSDGLDAVERLVNVLNQKHRSKYAFALSAPTEGSGTEAYAYLWDSTKFQLKSLSLIRDLNDSIQREPAYALFTDKKSNKKLSVINFHAVPKQKNAIRECALLVSFLEKISSSSNFIILGDFNEEPTPILQGMYKIHGFEKGNQDFKTTTRMEAKHGQHLAHAYDHIWYESDAFEATDSGVIDFTIYFEELSKSRTISDHLPIWVHFKWK